MIVFKEVIIKNFRGYEDETIDLGGKNGVLFVSGDNGSGKTTLINAIGWCLYGEVLFHTINTNSDVFSRWMSDGDITRVELSIEADDSSYHFTREIIKGSGINSSLTVIETGSDGNSNPLSTVDAEMIIRKIIPRDIKDLFFLNGENFSTTIFSSNNTNSLKESIYRVSEIDILDNATRHLMITESDYIKKIEKYGRNQEKIRELHDELDQHTNGLDGCEETIKKLKEEKEQLEKEDKKLIDTIKKTSSARQMIKTEESLEEQKKMLEESLCKAEADEVECFQKYYHMAILRDKAREYGEVLIEANRKGEIPSPIDPEITQQTLDSGICSLCEREIDEKIRRMIKEKHDDYRKKKSLQFLADGIRLFTGSEMVLSEKKYIMKDSISSILDCREKIAKISNEIKKIEDQLSPAVRANLTDNPVLTRQKIGKRLQMIMISLSNAGYEKMKHESEITLVRKKLSKIASSDSMTNRYSVKLEIIRNLLDNIQTIKTTLERTIRSKLEKQVSQTYSEVLSGNRFDGLQIDEDYRFTLSSKGNNYSPDDLSVGQAKALALSLIYALSKNLGYSATPIFIDNLYGQLSQVHYNDITKMVQNLATDKQVFISYLASEEVSKSYNNELVLHDYRVFWDTKLNKSVIKECSNGR